MTGEKIAIYESHRDHKKPLTFQVIVNTFIAANEIKIGQNMLSTAKDAQFEAEFVDENIKERFRKYHNSIAQLRIITIKQNLKLGGSERITKTKNPVIIQTELCN